MSGGEWRSVRKSEGESKPDAHFHSPSVIETSTKLIHTANPPFNSLPHSLSNNISDNLPTPPLIEFHTAIVISLKIYLQIICVTHDIVITHSCFTTCARYIASRSG